MNGKPEGKLSQEKLPAIEQAALAECDARDGVKDGLIEDPRQCQFDPSVLLCKGTENAECLTKPQIDTLKKIYQGPKDPQSGRQIYPGYGPGTEAEPGAWSIWIVGELCAIPVRQHLLRAGRARTDKLGLANHGLRP